MNSQGFVFLHMFLKLILAVEGTIYTPSFGEKVFYMTNRPANSGGSREPGSQ